MGLSASQAREFFFINRNNQIGGMLQRFANDKVDLARDSERVARRYHQALNQNSFKWTNNGGSSYMDITYNSLMKPSAMNQNNAYLLTDTNGKIVIDNSYKKYAELISPDGRPGGDYESNRTQILSALTGLSEEDIENQFISGWQNFEQQATVDNLLANKPEYPGYKAYTAEQLLGKLNSTSTLMGSSTHPILNARALQTAYTNSKEIDLGTGAYASSNLDTLFNQ